MSESTGQFRLVFPCGEEHEVTQDDMPHARDTHVELCNENCDTDDGELYRVSGDGGTEVVSESEVDNIDSEPGIETSDTEQVTVSSERTPEPAAPARETPTEPANAMAAATQNLSDPLQTLPDWMKTEVSYSDRGDSSTTINKRGCEVIANYLDLEVSFETLTAAEDTNFAYAYYSCTVTKPDGKSYTGFGTARADGCDQAENDGWKLEMMAQTRAYKRAVKFATGDGIEAFVHYNQSNE